MLNPPLYNICLSKEEYKKYARHLILENVGVDGQKRLKQANVLFIGAGGLASSGIIYLAALGIGCIGIIDNDIVSISNLHRQILYSSNNINELKVQATELKIHQINPQCKVITYPYPLNINNSIDLIKSYDLIIDTCDNFETRYIIDYMCYKLHKVHIYGAIENFEGQISVFNYKGGPRYSNLYPYNLQLKNNNCNNIGVLGLLPGIIGLLQATEAVKIILGIGNILSGYILVYNALNMSFKKFKVNTSINTKQIRIANESKISKFNIISYEQFNKMLRDNNLIIIDVRQRIEFRLSHIKNAINIPINYMKNQNTLQFLANNCLKKIIIIYCSSNSRAITASKVLYKHKIKHFRLKDGFEEKLATI